MLVLSNSAVNRQLSYNAFNLIFYILLLVSNFFRTLIFSCFFCSLLALYLKRNGVYGLAEVFIRCKEKGYTRSFASMCRLNVYDFQATEIDTIKLFDTIKKTQHALSHLINSVYLTFS